ncbi:MAG: hypothetical protein ACRERE_42375 [Candidatus Entotheonellia bacterium]
MRINGEWLLFEDGVVRPVIRGEILDGHGLGSRLNFWWIQVQTGRCSVRQFSEHSVFSPLRLKRVSAG